MKEEKLTFEDSISQIFYEHLQNKQHNKESLSSMVGFFLASTVTSLEYLLAYQVMHNADLEDLQKICADLQTALESSCGAVIEEVCTGGSHERFKFLETH